MSLSILKKTGEKGKNNAEERAISDTKTKTNLDNKNQNLLTVLHQNINSLAKKTNRLHHLLESLEPDLVIITEHGLKDEELKNTRIPGYNLVGGYSRSTARKGGVAIFSSETLGNITTSIDIPQTSIELTCELHLIKLKIRKQDLYLLGVYRPPSGNLDTALDTIVSTLDPIPIWKCPTIIMGDVNVDSLNLSGDRKKQEDKKKLENTLASLNITRLNLPPTRVTHDSTSSIDAVCSNLDEEHIDAKVIVTGLSDHRAQLCTVHLQKSEANPPSSTRRHFTQENLNQLREVLKAEIWENVYNSEDVNQAYDYFDNTIRRALNVTCPKKKIRPRRNQKIKIFLNEDIHRLKGEYLKALNNEILRGRAEDKAETAAKKKSYDLRLKELRKKSTANFIQSSSNKQKALWKVIKNERKNSNEKTFKLIELCVNGNILKDPTSVAQHLNHHFITVADKTLKNKGKTPTGNPCLPLGNNPPDLMLLPTTYKEVLETITSLKSKPSAGVDELSSVLLKHCKEELVCPLTSIINKSFTQGIFPTSLKIAKVFPKFKSGQLSETNNYRPISLLSTVSKVIEKIMLMRLTTHLTEHNILTPHQHGFTKGKSTTSALIQLTEFIIDQIEAGNAVTSFFLDFSKAFDCLGHHILLEKLRALGIRGTAEKWITSYLVGRTQIVELSYMKNNTIHTACSTPLPIKRGVPQGSVLGPVLFILLSNDLPYHVQEYCQGLMYADDTALLVAKNELEELEITSFIAMNMATQYCSQNDLVLNKTKTQQLNFGRRTTEHTGLSDLLASNEVKYLGVTIDNKLSWDTHTDQLCGKLNTSIYVLKRIKNISTSETAKLAYFSLFESYLRYGLIVWGNSSRKNIQRILVLQKRAIRILAGLNPLESCRTVFKEMKILTVVSLYILETIKYAIKTNLQKTGQLHRYNTRNGNNFLLPIHHLTQTEEKPSYIGSKLFNMLPVHLKKISTEKHFKKELQEWLLARPFYAKEEYYAWNT